MIIRTVEQLNDCKISNRLSPYLPWNIAFRLPEIIADLSIKAIAPEQHIDALKLLNAELQKSEYQCQGFYSKARGTDLHTCHVAFEENVCTYGESNAGISGKNSLGIAFTDPDDDYNDWIWIATDVLFLLAYAFAPVKQQIPSSSSASSSDSSSTHLAKTYQLISPSSHF